MADDFKDKGGALFGLILLTVGVKVVAAAGVSDGSAGEKAGLSIMGALCLLVGCCCCISACPTAEKKEKRRGYHNLGDSNDAMFAVVEERKQDIDPENPQFGA